MTATTFELSLLRYLLKYLHVPKLYATILFWNNQVASHTYAYSVYHERTKHVELDCYIVRERNKRGEIKITYVQSGNLIADIFTKPLQSPTLHTYLSKLIVTNITLQL